MILSIVQPPFQITQGILKQLTAIARLLGKVEVLHLERPSTALRKENQIKTIHSSLQIEGNTLSESQITALMNGKRVVGPQKDLLEVQNAISVYDRLNEFDPLSEDSFLSAHRDLMSGLVTDAGQYREGGVGVVQGDELAHMAPGASRVPGLMRALFEYIQHSGDEVLIQSCVFHYELEFIHPFSDGNGRMGRLWQNLLLLKAYPVFEFLPFESLIRDVQTEYYHALAKSDQSGHSTPFIEFMLGILEKSLGELVHEHPRSLGSQDRMSIFLETCQDEFSRKDYLAVFKEISAPTASRDLKEALQMNRIEKVGERNQTRYRVIRKV